MLIGHFGVAFAAKSVVPRTSLGTLFLAAQSLDLLCAMLLLLGVERVRIAPGITAVTPLLFEYYPISHSLLAALGWAVLAGGVGLMFRRARIEVTMLGALVISHWLLDAIVHRPDLPLFPGSTTVVGLNAWSSLPLSMAIEVPLFVLGAWFYSRVTAPRDAIGRWGLAALIVCLLAIYAGSLFGTPPPDATTLAWVGQLQWLLVLWGYWIDKHRAGLRPGLPPVAAQTRG